MFNILVSNRKHRHEIVLWLGDRGINYSWKDEWGDRYIGKYGVFKGWRISVGCIDEDEKVWFLLIFGEYIV